MILIKVLYLYLFHHFCWKKMLDIDLQCWIYFLQDTLYTRVSCMNPRFKTTDWLTFWRTPCILPIRDNSKCSRQAITSNVSAIFGHRDEHWIPNPGIQFKTTKWLQGQLSFNWVQGTTGDLLVKSKLSWRRGVLHHFIQQNFNSDSVQVQTLLAVCRIFAVVRISNNVPDWKQGVNTVRRSAILQK